MSEHGKKGIVDPWRVVEPLERPVRPPAPKQKKISLNEIDWDADIRDTRSYVFRSRQASVSIFSKVIQTPSDALYELVNCLFSVLEMKDGPDLVEAAEIGFSIDDREWNLSNASQATQHSTPEGYPFRVRLRFLNQDHDAGMLRLVRLLNAVAQRPEGASLLKQQGITPMTR